MAIRVVGDALDHETRYFRLIPNAGSLHLERDDVVFMSEPVAMESGPHIRVARSDGSEMNSRRLQLSFGMGFQFLGLFLEGKTAPHDLVDTATAPQFLARGPSGPSTNKTARACARESRLRGIWPVAMNVSRREEFVLGSAPVSIEGRHECP